MPCDQFLQCSRPIIYETDESDPALAEDYAYWMKGTCFLLEHADRIFVVTARHVLKNQVTHHEDPIAIRNQVRIFYYDASLDFLPLDRFIQISGEDECYKDIAVFQVATNLVAREELPRISRIIINDLEELISRPLPIRPNMQLITRGYPAQISYIDYERYRLRPRAAIIGARLSGANGLKFLLRMHWLPNHITALERDREVAQYFDLNGLSGSPVFDAENCTFLGMLIMGSRTVGHFIDGRIVFRVVQDIIRKTSVPNAR